MNGREVVVFLMQQEGVTQTELSRKMNTTPMNIYQRLKRPNTGNKGDINVKTLVDMLGCIGYEVIVRKKGKKRSEEFIVDEIEEQGNETE